MTLSEALEWYQEKLLTAEASGTAGVSKQFAMRLRAQPEAAQAEAATYHFLSVKNLQPQLLENPSFGGLDFECSFGNQKFAVEVTSFTNETVSKRSGFPNELSAPGYIDLRQSSHSCEVVFRRRRCRRVRTEDHASSLSAQHTW